MNISARERRRAFSQWMRTGIWPGDPDAEGIEHKFNPYHDPRNGQFTFAPGGPRSLSHVTISHGRGKGWRTFRGSPVSSDAVRSSGSPIETHPTAIGDARSPVLAGSRLERGEGEAVQLFAPPETTRSSRRGGSGRHYEEERTDAGDPDALEHAFPGLRGSPAGAIVAVADGLFDLSGPSHAATAALARNWSNALENDIKRIVPGFRYLTAAPERTFQGQVNRLNDLRWLRARAYVLVKKDYGPLQVEMLRFMQENADQAYDQALALLEARGLKIRLSDREAIGNYVDSVVRSRLRMRLARYGLKALGGELVRVNRREKGTVGGEVAYRRPDARIGAIAFDVTLTEKTLKTPQIRGFFATDFQPAHVIIIRPRQVGGPSTYAIKRPEAAE